MAESTDKFLPRIRDFLQSFSRFDRSVDDGQGVNNLRRFLTIVRKPINSFDVREVSPKFFEGEARSTRRESRAPYLSDETRKKSGIGLSAIKVMKEISAQVDIFV